MADISNKITSADTPTKRLAVSALMSAFSVLLYLLSNVPVISFVGVMLCPVPLTWIGYCYGMKQLLLATAVSTVLTGLVAGPVQAYFFFSLFAIVAIVTGYSLFKKFQPGKILIVGSIVMMFFNIFFYYGVEKTLGLEDFLEQARKSFQEYTVKASEMIPDNVMSSQNKAIAVNGFNHMLELLLEFPLSLFTLASFAAIYINYFVCSFVFMKLAKPIPMMEPVFLWKGPWWMIVPILIILTMKAYPATNPPGSLRAESIYFNLISIFYLAYFFLGMGVINFYLIKYRFPWPVRLIALPLMFWYGQITALVGTVDSFFDFRDLAKLAKIRDQRKTGKYTRKKRQT